MPPLARRGGDKAGAVPSREARHKPRRESGGKEAASAQPEFRGEDSHSDDGLTILCVRERGLPHHRVKLAEGPKDAAC